MLKAFSCIKQLSNKLKVYSYTKYTVRKFSHTMPPLKDPTPVDQLVNTAISENKVMVFSKKTCPYCVRVKRLFKRNQVPFNAIELDEIPNGDQVQKFLEEKTKQSTVPNVFISGVHVGDSEKTLEKFDDGSLQLLYSGFNPEHGYQYDLVVIGGGSGGLSAAKEAARLGRKVALFDFVKPSPSGTSWGLGGTCVNVGCIPKKLMHQAALLREGMRDAENFGWPNANQQKTHDWNVMVENIDNYIRSLNFNYRKELNMAGVDYKNAYAELRDQHTIFARYLKKKKPTEETVTAAHILLATGGRPRFPDIPGASEFAISSDDLFWLRYCPGETVVVGASYVALECAGFLSGLGLKVTCMVRSILLRGFDQQMAEMIGKYMANNAGVNFMRPCVPTRVERLEEGEPGRLRVHYKLGDGTEGSVDCNTCLFAVGRDPCTKEMNLDKIGVELNPKDDKIIANNEHTNIPSIHAVGDIVDGGLELTPVAIQAGLLLARRLFGFGELMNYENVATTVFTPLEYGAIGLPEEYAIAMYGSDNIEVYHTHFKPLEWALSDHHPPSGCYAKLICVINEDDRIVGLHVLGPNAGEITQGYAVAIKAGATKALFDQTVGIHPTCSEVFTTVTITKRSGADPVPLGC